MSSFYYYIHKPFINMREEPSHNSKVVSQAFFAEKILIKELFENWVLILSSDGYEGWMESGNLISRQTPYQSKMRITRLAAHIYPIKDIEFGPMLTLPYGSCLEFAEEADQRWIKVLLPDGKECFVQRGDVRDDRPLSRKDELVAFSKKFLGIPYTWGGRTSFGFDCSGFIQMLYNEIGVRLQRDARQQILDGQLKTISFQDIEPADLIFFGKSEQKIMHVGMNMGNGEFIHASSRENQPWIRISRLADAEWSGHSDAHYPYRVFRRLINRDA